MVISSDVVTCWSLIYIVSLIFIPGSMEREVLKNFEDIVHRTLPVDKVAQYYKECPGTAKAVILNYVTYFEERIMVLNIFINT